MLTLSTHNDVESSRYHFNIGDEITATGRRAALPMFQTQAWSNFRSEGRSVLFPCWLPVVFFALLTVFIRPAPRFKFSLRDQFTLTTVAVLTVGLLAFCLRSIS